MEIQKRKDMDARVTVEYLEQEVLDWADKRGILVHGSRKAQGYKTLEECGELIYSLGIEDRGEIRDAIGDIIVTLIIQANMNDMSLLECLKEAYSVIKNRKGKLINGQFVKE